MNGASGTDVKEKTSAPAGADVRKLEPELPVESEHQLTQAATRIVGVARVVVEAGRRENASARTGIRDVVEVDVVEHVQHVETDLEVRASLEGELLGHAHVEPREPRRADHDR